MPKDFETWSDYLKDHQQYLLERSLCPAYAEWCDAQVMEPGEYLPTLTEWREAIEPYNAFNKKYA